jgi:hypothetical protein
VLPAVATKNSLVAVAWNGNVNGPDSYLYGPNPPLSWSPMARLFSGPAESLREDFRLDLADRATAGTARVARTMAADRFLFVWTDWRSGPNVRARVMPSV